ncbi:hypothetical protein L3X38_034182 [Prunus dulcis]|uniref:Uncharacterized protein n=1 Tax=Prunus dulcis TaxID=3755 RepID=A0AAD4VIR2_PRUDU|nr:hypothetical protein L3X38_034182 [Prunus dulcis]
MAGVGVSVGDGGKRDGKEESMLVGGEEGMLVGGVEGDVLVSGVACVSGLDKYGKGEERLERRFRVLTKTSVGSDTI